MDFSDNACMKYHGLLNQGATSHLNSVLQVLFMTREFREAVHRHSCDSPDGDYLDHQLKDLFDDLQRHTAYTYKITNRLGIDRGEQHHDAAECFEKILTLTSPDASQIFRGQLKHKTICSKCATETNTESPIWHLPLALTHSPSEEYCVEDGISEFFRDSNQCGENQMYCDGCSCKVDATLKCELSHHPDVLMLLLKRFEINYSDRTYVKNNRAVNVPFTLKTPARQTYELYAAVDHVGDLRNGNYTAFIKSQDDERWYTFNDTTVTLIDYPPFTLQNMSRTVYLLFYRKQTTPIKYHGLLNQGATCYLNSVLQALFMTREFREAVERHTCSHTCENPHTEYLDHQLKDLFDDLQRYPAYTYKISNKLGISVEPEQHNAAEYFEKILSLTSPAASQIFHGELMHQTICVKCETVKNTSSPVWYLPLALMESSSEEYRVVDGIEEYFRDSHFTGQDQMYCDQCDHKVDVTFRCEVKHHPEVLVLLLKRFEFDYRYMTHVKNNCAVRTPLYLQIPESQTYELYAAVDHAGDLRGGHYTAVIKSQDDQQWYRFNDTNVTRLDFQPFQVDDTETSNFAYLLFYRRQETHGAETFSQDISEVSIKRCSLPTTSDNYSQSQATETVRQTEEEEEGNDTAETVSTERNKDEGIRDRVHVEPRAVEPVVPEPKACVEDQDSGVYVKQSEPHTETDEGKIMRPDEEIRRRHEADDQTEKREALPTETETDQRSEDQKADKAPHSKHDFTPEVSDRCPTHSYTHIHPVCEENTDLQVITEGKSRDSELASESVNLQIRNDLYQYTEDVRDRKPVHEGAKKKVKGREGADDSYAPRREQSETCDSEGADYHHNSKLPHGNIKHISRQHRGEEEIIKVELKKGKKHGDEEGAGVKPQNKSHDKCQREINDFNLRQFEQEEKKSDAKTKDEDVERRRTSGRYRGGGEEDHRNQQQQENKHKDVDDQNKGDEKNRDNVDTQRCRAHVIDKEGQHEV